MSKMSSLPEEFKRLLELDDLELFSQLYVEVSGFFDVASPTEVASTASVLRHYYAVAESDFLLGQEGFGALVRHYEGDLGSISDSYVAIGTLEASAIIKAAMKELPESVLRASCEVRHATYQDPEIEAPLGIVGKYLKAYFEVNRDMGRHIGNIVRKNVDAFLPVFS